MAKVVRSKDCGNSPRNRRVEDISVALATGAGKAITDLTSEDVVWVIAGENTFNGRAEVMDAAEADARGIVRLAIVHVMSHGKIGAADGVVEFKSGKFGFCNVIEFRSAGATAVQHITTYRVKL